MEYKGFTYTPTPKTAWDNLSMLEKSEMMKAAVRNGITDLKTIREKYNEFAEGGSKEEEGEVNTDRQYFRTMEKVADENYQKWGFSNPDEALLHALNDNTYDYRGYYNKYPQSQANADTHWTDEFKTAYHPTFSRESIYSGRKSQYNPLGLPGGFWSEETFVPMGWQLGANEYKKGGDIHIKDSKKGTFTAAASRHNMGVQEFASKVLANKDNYSPAIVKKANFARNASKWKHGLGGNLFDGISEDTQQMNKTNIFRRPNGEYFYQASPESEEIAVTPIMTTLGDESMWTYQDENGRRYTPRLTSNEGIVTQGETPSTWEKIIAASNNNYMNPVLGAPARWKASWDNNTNVIRALWDNPAVMGHPLGIAAKTVEHLAGDEGIPKTIRLYQNSDGSDNARWLWQRSLVGDALESLGLLPAVGMGYNAAKPAIDRTVTILQNNYPALENMPSARQQLGLNATYKAYPNIRYDIPSNDIIIESNISATPNIPFDEAWLAASKGRHQMSNLVGSGDYASRVRQAYQENGIPVNQADFEILQAKQGIEDSNLKVIPNLKSENGEVLNGQYNPNTRQVLVSQDRDNILDVAESSGHEHAHASEVERLLELLKEKWKHIKPRKEAFTRSDGSVDTEWKDYISKIVEMRAPAMSVWSEMKELGFNKVGDYLHHLKRFGLEDKQWEALVNRYGLTNAKYMVETVFGLSPFVIYGINNEEKDSTTM